MNDRKPFGKGGILSKPRTESCIVYSGNHAPAMLRPWISTNLAISADGKISSVTKRPSGWTSAADHARLQELRQAADALMVGRGTLEADGMTMTVPGKSQQPLRCIVSRTGHLSSNLPIFEKAGGQIHLLITSESSHIERDGIIVHRKSLAEFLETLALNPRIKHLHCEGGGELIRSLAELDAIDEYHLTWAGHTIFGGRGAPTPTGIPDEFLPSSHAYELSHFEPRPELAECFVSYRRIGGSASVQ